MFGERLLARSLTTPTVADKFGNLWQYHPRSDHHSRIACWGVMLDLLRTCRLLRDHVEAGKVVFGINHKMTDFVTGRTKALDLVICEPRKENKTKRRQDFAGLADAYAIVLDNEERAVLHGLPRLVQGAVGDVLVALESKACMTAHIKAVSRLFDELTSAAQCINGSAPGAIAIGHALVNVSPAFVSPDRNRHRLTTARTVTSADIQPESWRKALSAVRSLVVRGHATDRGYDAIGLTMLAATNDGSDVAVAPEPPSLASSDPLNYERMIRRVSGLYDTRFQNR